MISSRHNVYSFGRNGAVGVVDCVVNEHLVSTLPRLPLHIVHKAAPKDYDFGVVGHASVPVAALDDVGGAEF